MRFLSVSSPNADAYRAGREVGARLGSITPEAILLFASMSYEESFADLTAGLYDGLGTSSPLVFGCTGDGVYETSMAANYGVSALGIDSGGKLGFSLALQHGVGSDSYWAGRECALLALEACTTSPTLALVVADGANADGERLTEGIKSVLNVPFFGGLAGDDRKFSKTRLFADGQEHSDAVAILLISGPLDFTINAASGFTPVGNPSTVDSAQGSEIRYIGGLTAQAFIKEQSGIPLLDSDLGIVPLAVYAPEGDTHFLRTTSHMNPDGSINTFGGVAQGSKVRVCAANRDEVLDAVRSAVSGQLAGLGAPRAAVVVSCAGRKWLLDDAGDQELNLLFEALGQKIPLVGFPSFGEISPFRREDGTLTPSYFHNVTFGLLLLGDAP